MTDDMQEKARALVRKLAQIDGLDTVPRTEDGYFFTIEGMAAIETALREAHAAGKTAGEAQPVAADARKAGEKVMSWIARSLDESAELPTFEEIETYLTAFAQSREAAALERAVAAVKVRADADNLTDRAVWYVFAIEVLRALIPPTKTGDAKCSE